MFGKTLVLFRSKYTGISNRGGKCVPHAVHIRSTRKVSVPAIELNRDVARMTVRTCSAKVPYHCIALMSAKGGGKLRKERLIECHNPANLAVA